MFGDFGGDASRGEVVNDAGQAAGYAYTPGQTEVHAFVWTEASGKVDLGTLGGVLSQPRGINATGEVVGGSYIANGHLHAYSWTQAGGMVDLGTLAGHDESDALDVADNGQVVGFGCSTQDISHSLRGYSWTQSDGMRELGTLGGVNSEAFVVNESGEAAGLSTTQSGATHATLWRTAVGPADVDNDGVPDAQDNCPSVANADQADMDHDGLGNACDPDANGDGVADTLQPSGTPVGSFSNVVPGKTNPTTGSVVSGSVTVADLADPAKGVQITATTNAVLSVCGGFELDLQAGMAATVTCSSVIVENVTGPGAVTVKVPGGQAVVTFPAGTAGTVDTAPGGGATVTSVSGTGVTLTVGGTTAPVGVGGLNLIVGKAGSDKINGTAGNDMIVGNGGNDHDRWQGR